MINSSVKGEYLDSPRVEAFFELICELDVPVFVHPPQVTIGNEKMEVFRLPTMVGRPVDTTLSIARFILSGGLERFPTLKLICAHMGGALAMLPGRLDYGYELRNEVESASDGGWTPDVLTKPPSEYISQLYVDTFGFWAPALMCCVGTFGVGRVVLGSDCPPVPIPISRTIDLVRNLPLSIDDREAILGGNAARIFKI